MKMSKSLLAVFCIALLGAADATAANLSISIGFRETDDGNGPALTNDGASGGIEWVNLDGQLLAVDNTWQTFTFTPSLDALTAFAGSTANGALEDGLEWGTLEHIRIRNSDGITTPITLWIDDVTVNQDAGPTVEGFEGAALDAEVMFQEPSFSGSTGSNLVTGSMAGVTDITAATGSQSYQTDFQYVDSLNTRWVRLTTSGRNPAIRVVEPLAAAAPTLTFTLKAVTVPEPTTGCMLLVASIGLAAIRRKRS